MTEKDQKKRKSEFIVTIIMEIVYVINLINYFVTDKIGIAVLWGIALIFNSIVLVGKAKEYRKILR